MTDNVDFRKLIDQEPDFGEFAKQVLFESTIMTQADFLKAIYSFWSVGISVDQTVDWLVTSMRLNRENHE